jgi:hypothetical protein
MSGDDELLVISYNLSFAVQKDWLFPVASEWWLVKEGREAHGGDQHDFDSKSPDERNFLAEWKISLCTKNAMEALSELRGPHGKFDLIGLQECNQVERPRSFHADPTKWKAGFGFTSSAVQYLDALLCGTKCEAPELSDFRDEPGMEEMESRPNTVLFQSLGYVRSTLYGAGSIAAVVYNRDTMGPHQRVAEGECETEAAIAGDSVLAGRPFLAVYFEKRNIVVINIHAPRTEDAKSGMQSYTKQQYQAMYDRIGPHVRELVVSCGARVILVSDSNDELHIATEKSEGGAGAACSHEFIDMALSADQRLRLCMPGVRDQPAFETQSRPGYLPRTAAWPTQVKVKVATETEPEQPDDGGDAPNEKDKYKYVAKYHPSGPKFSATIDLILDSGWVADSKKYRATLGVPPTMDYGAQYDAARAAGPGSAFADTPWDQMNKAHFTWMSDHAPMCLHSAIHRS